MSISDLVSLLHLVLAFLFGLLATYMFLNKSEKEEVSDMEKRFTYALVYLFVFLTAVVLTSYYLEKLFK
jgi:heme O synthase-like polyprenyltransferase